MTTTKQISSESIISQTLRDFKIEDTSWVNDGIDWIGSAIEAIGYHCGFKKKRVTIEVKNHLASLPCDLISLYGVAYKNVRLPLGSDVSGLNLYASENADSITNISQQDFLNLRVLWTKYAVYEEKQTLTEQDVLDMEDLLKQINQITTDKRLNNSVIEQSILPYYNINANYIQTSFSEGEITVLYTAFMLDDKGFPMIIDTYKYREAVKWYIFRGLMMQGYKHPTFDFNMADGMWEKFRHKASCEQKMPSLDSLDRFHNRWHSIKRGLHLASDWYTNAETKQGTIY